MDGIEAFKDDDYPNGAIRKLIFHDFLTYGHVECYPGPHLNVIIGPNGTGKSTIICGICLACGGSPKLLGRSDCVGDFIRHGKVEGYVEMMLKDDSKDEGVRTFKILLRKPNNATFYIDGRRVTLHVHQHEIARYNIQVGNPCTFLAQDKVKSFAEQDPKSLLFNTEKAGPTELSELHEKLIEKAQFGSQMHTIEVQQKNRLNELQCKIAAIRPKAENYLMRQQLNAHIKTFRIKIAFLCFSDAEQACQLSKVDLDAAKAAYQNARNQKVPLEKQYRHFNNKFMECNVDRHKGTLAQIKLRLNDRIRTFKNSFDDQEVESARRRFENTKKIHNTWDCELKAIQESIGVFKQHLENLEKNPPDTTIYDGKKAEYKQLKSKHDRVLQEMDTEFRDIMSKKTIHNQRLEAYQSNLMSRARDLVTRDPMFYQVPRVWEWYVKNKDKFQYPVYVPYLFMDMKKEDLIYFNNCIGKRDLGMFVFGCYEDEKLVMTQIHDVRINSTVVTQAMQDRFNQHFELPENLRKLGFVDFLSNMFTAPPPVRAYLISVHNLHRIPVGGREVDMHSEKIAEEIRNTINLFFTNEHRVNVIKSLYDRSRCSVSRAKLRPNGILTVNPALSAVNLSDNKESFDNKLMDIEDRRNALKPEQTALERLRAELMEMNCVIQAEKDKITTAQSNLEKAIRQEQNHVRDKPNLQAAEDALREIERKSKEAVPVEFEAIVRQLEDYRNAIKDVVIVDLESRRLRAASQIVKAQMEDLETLVADTKEKYDQCVQFDHSKKKAFESAKRELVACANVSTIRADDAQDDRERQTIKKIEKAFEKHHVEDSVEACQKQIDQEEVRAEIADSGGSLNDVEELARLEEREEVMKNEINSTEEKRNNWKDDLKKLLDEWRTPVQSLVDRISGNFSRYFERIKCGGEVRFSVPEDELRIDQYGIDIWVRFAGYTSLRRLTPQQQSGGERSVSTMLYLMALQELCPVPFRCVDEINQGMDPNNERMVFDMMVELLSSPGTLSHTQYFLLTPKLLPDLKFNEKVTVLLIQNSAMMTRGSDTLTITGADYEISTHA